MLAPVLVALTSAALFALGGSLQHRAAGSSPSSSKRDLVRQLLARRSWLIGAGLCATAFGLHAVALSLGDLTVVQPIILSGIVFAVLARPLLDHRLPSLAETGWAAVAWSGLVLFIVTLRPGAPQQPSPSRAFLLLGVGLGAAIGLMVLGRAWRGRPVPRGAALAGAAGVLFGLVAGLVKLTMSKLATDGGTAAALSWPLWTLLAVGGCAVLTNERAYQSTELSVTAPILNIAQLAVSMSFGVVVFDEHLFAGMLGVGLEAIGLLVMVFSVVRLSMRATEPCGSGDERPRHPERDESLPREPTG